MITSFIPILEDKLTKIKNTLKTELQRAKSERRKDVMKRLVKYAKELQKTIKEAKKHMQRPVHTVVEKYFKKNLLTKESFSW